MEEHHAHLVPRIDPGHLSQGLCVSMAFGYLFGKKRYSGLQVVSCHERSVVSGIPMTHLPTPPPDLGLPRHRWHPTRDRLGATKAEAAASYHCD
jgi:hypothetical protein